MVQYILGGKLVVAYISMAVMAGFIGHAWMAWRAILADCSSLVLELTPIWVVITVDISDTHRDGIARA